MFLNVGFLCFVAQIILACSALQGLAYQGLGYLSSAMITLGLG
jgi:hypothetical protein